MTISSGLNSFTFDNSYARLPETFYARYPYDVRPPSDDRPFFFNTMKPSHYLSLWRDPLPGQAASRLTAWLFVVIAGFVIALIAVPMAALRDRSLAASGVARKSSYFAAIGLGFILVEIAMIEFLSLYLGHPVYSLVAVVSSVLVFAALGARVTRRLELPQLRRVGRILLGALVAALVGYAVWVPELVGSTASQPIAVRSAVAVALLAPIAALMGTALPCGIRRVESESPLLIPWMWAINGGVTVLGSVLAIILSMNLGIPATLVVGAAAYVVAASSLP